MYVFRNPSRFTSGMTPDSVGQPLANCGAGNPAFYHTFFDEFDKFAGYTTTSATTGTAALVAGDGGLLALTTAATSGDNESIQPTVASFKLLAGARTFFYTRLQVSATSAAFQVGLLNTTTTPLTATDGISIVKATGTGNLTLRTVVGGSAVSTVIPNSSMLASTYYDLAFELTSKGDILVYFGIGLIGVPPNTLAGLLGADLRVTQPALTAVNLAPTVAVQAGAAVATVLTTDFVFAAKERG